MSDDERWRKMTPTERERNAVIIAEALQKTFDRITELEAQVSRLQKGIRDMNFDLWDMIGEPQAADTDEQITARYLHPGDLDPVGGDDELPR